MTIGELAGWLERRVIEGWEWFLNVEIFDAALFVIGISLFVNIANINNYLEEGRGWPLEFARLCGIGAACIGAVCIASAFGVTDAARLVLLGSGVSVVLLGQMLAGIAVDRLPTHWYRTASLLEVFALVVGVIGVFLIIGAFIAT